MELPRNHFKTRWSSTTHATHPNATQTPTPEWLQQVRAEWWFHATLGVTGCVSVNLERIAAPDASRLEVMRAVVDETATRLNRGGTCSAARLNTLRLGGQGAEWSQDVEHADIRAVADAIAALLDGEMDWDAATSPVFHAGRELSSPRPRRGS